MTARTRQRGHRIKWAGHKWVYTNWDDKSRVQGGGERPCASCGKRSEGPDACLGKLPQVRAACCGHGHPEDAYFIFHDGTELRGEDAVRLKGCWTDHPMTPGDVIEMYLRARDVESTYRLCHLCRIGVKAQELLGIVDTFRRNSLDIAPFCDILEVYSERNTNRETSMNTKAITNIQRQAGVLSDGHQEVVDQAVATTAAIIALDARQRRGSGAGVRIYAHQVSQHLDCLQEQLKAQAARALRVCDEVEQIKRNLIIV